MGRHFVITSAAGTSATPPLVKGTVVELTASQETALAADLRAVTHRDRSGESVGVSN